LAYAESDLVWTGTILRLSRSDGSKGRSTRLDPVLGIENTIDPVVDLRNANQLQMTLASADRVHIPDRVRSLDRALIPDQR
jgi:hypothetical protein